ncbi:MAG: alpha-amylase family glycosyl hydrolase [Christensenellales bacterium]
MENKWWQNAVGYQIYIKSFCDSNGDGIGDINGILSKLKYLKSLGVDFIWICPFFKSPMEDNGYDISDYYSVSPEFGTIDDLQKLIKEAHKLGIKVLIDLVINHTSSKNEWFIKSENREDNFSDFYYWADPVIKNGKKMPPNNWQSFFSGSAWTYSEKRGQYYLRVFSSNMPDINYNSLVAKQEIEKVIKYYAELNVDGFRVDAISHIGKAKFNKKGKGKRFYKPFSNQNNAHTYLKEFNKIFKKYGLFSLGELGGDPSKIDKQRYLSGELDAICTFEQVGAFNSDGTINKSKLLSALKTKLGNGETAGKSALFYFNHDYQRLISAVCAEKDSFNASICLAVLMMMLKGVPIIYNGEEIGMTNYPFNSAEEFEDINAKMIINSSLDKEKAVEELKQHSRDNSRTIMQWNDEIYAGFSLAKPWFVVNDNYKTINVKNEEKEPNSCLNVYKKIISTRKDIIKIINEGKFKFFRKLNVLGYKIKSEFGNIRVVANLSEKVAKVNSLGNILFSNYTEISGINLMPYEVRIEKF